MHVGSQPPTANLFIKHFSKVEGGALFLASLLKFALFEIYNYLINFQPVLLGAPLQLGAISARLVRLWINPALGNAFSLLARCH